GITECKHLLPGREPLKRLVPRNAPDGSVHDLLPDLAFHAGKGSELAVEGLFLNTEVKAEAVYGRGLFTRLQHNIPVRTGDLLPARRRRFFGGRFSRGFHVGRTIEP